MIFAQARIVFDTNDPIDTPLIFNMIGPRLDDNAPEALATRPVPRRSG